MSEIVRDSLQHMYDLGKEHGYRQALRDIKIKALELEVEANNATNND